MLPGGGGEQQVWGRDSRGEAVGCWLLALSCWLLGRAQLAERSPKSQQPRANSQEPTAKSQQPRANSQEPTASPKHLGRQPLHHLPELPRAESLREAAHHLLHHQVLLEQPVDLLPRRA